MPTGYTSLGTAEIQVKMVQCKSLVYCVSGMKHLVFSLDPFQVSQMVIVHIYLFADIPLPFLCRLLGAN